MGMYLNNMCAYLAYKEISESQYFVDKTLLIQELMSGVEESAKYICITRPRRFGKTVMANMIGAFFSNVCDSSEIFDKLKIAQEPEYRRYLNRCNVIYIDFSEVDDECSSYTSYIGNIKEILREDLHRAYPNVFFREKGTVSEDLKRIQNETGERFLFVLDEWDAFFHMPFFRKEDGKKYLLFLKGLLKDKSYVSLAYVTGVLPIAKYSSGSELNMFLEYTMAAEERFSEYFGFTEKEVDELYERYAANTPNAKVTREGLRMWYDGYSTRSGERVYNPRSVVASLINNNFGNYWTSSGPYDEIFYYIKNNIAEVQEELALMVSGEAVMSNVQEYAATSMELQTKDEIFSAMVVYGFLSYEDGKVSIPNKELMDKFADMLRRESSLGYIYRLAKESDRMLQATLSGDTKTMEEILAYAHNTETPLWRYNNENELTAVVNLVYLSARNFYDIEREDKAGIGYVDFIFYPRRKGADCIILELKVDVAPEEAIQQIRDRRYALRFQGKLGEERQYTGRILAVGISYTREKKEHRCKVEIL